MLSGRRYEEALNDALEWFAKRLVAHPDFLIALQEIADEVRR
jgi:hypothetical protein